MSSVDILYVMVSSDVFVCFKYHEEIMLSRSRDPRLRIVVENTQAKLR